VNFLTTDNYLELVAIHYQSYKFPISMLGKKKKKEWTINEILVCVKYN